MPVAPTADLAPLVVSWEAALASAGHDVHGDLSMLVSPSSAVALPGPRDQLGVAVDALAEALADNSRLRASVAGLEASHARLDRKRRKLKRRLAKSGSGRQAG